MSGLANGRNGFPEAADPALGASAAAAAHRAREVRRPVLSRRRRAGRARRLDRLVRLSRLAAPGRVGPGLRASRRQAIGRRAHRIGASTLSRDQRVTDHQLMEICLRRDLPDRARYVLAEAVSTEAVARDPRAYALTVARSQDWPDWLRLVLARRLAYGATRGYAIPEIGTRGASEAS